LFRALPGALAPCRRSRAQPVVKAFDFCICIASESSSSSSSSSSPYRLPPPQLLLLLPVPLKVGQHAQAPCQELAHDLSRCCAPGQNRCCARSDALFLSLAFCADRRHSAAAWIQVAADQTLVGACAGSSRNGELHGHSLTFGPPAVSAHAAFSSSREAPWHKHCARSRAHAAPTEVHRTCCASDAWSWC